jgi:hypothetical protein
MGGLFYTMLPWLAALALVLLLIFAAAQGSGGYYGGGYYGGGHYGSGFNFDGVKVFYYVVTFLWIVGVVLSFLYSLGVLDFDEDEKEMKQVAKRA